MRIGVDFDNTIACYQGVFSDIARQKKLIPDSLSDTKTAVRDYLRAEAREAEWTELQGYVYGPGMKQVKPFPGVMEFFRQSQADDNEVLIISHRTRQPFIGEKYDLHQAALDWLKGTEILGGRDPLLKPDRVFFETTKEAKLARISQVGCQYFIDDLPELLCSPQFPDEVQRVLFDPFNEHAQSVNYRKVANWSEVAEVIRG